MKYLKRHLTLVRMSALALLMSCISPQGGDTSRDLGVNSSETERIKNSKILKIVYQNNNTIFQDHTLDVNDSVTLRAGLFDIGGDFLGTVPASWSINSSSFNANNLVASSDAKSATFTPTNIGATRITAVYAGSDNSVITTTDSTGIISVTHLQTPNAMSIVAGDNQTGVVNTNLTTPLEVLVTDSYAIPIQGIEVSFSVQTGSGAIIGLSNVFTNASGRASVSVKLGTIAGSSNNVFRAAVVSNPAIFADFSANALPGSPSMLTYTNSPGDSYANIVFPSHIRVQARDQFSNALDISSGVVTLTVQTGSGNLGGTLSATFANGVATFDDVFYDSVDTGVIVRASYGGITQDSLPFDVSSAPPGACTSEVPGQFTTGNGGCQDIAQGLTWSRGSGFGMTFYDAIWDSTLPGASAPDQYDYGRTNDYNNAGCIPATFYFCDNDVSANTGAHLPSTTSYCKDLVQGGYEDWRVPTRIELQTTIGNEGVTGLAPVLNYNGGSNFISSDYFSNAYVLAISRISGGAQNFDKTRVDMHAICVRGNRSDLTRLRVVNGPSEMSYGESPASDFVVHVEQADGKRGTAQNVAITVTSSHGTTTGTTTVLTDNSGVARFDDFQVIGASRGTITLSFNATGFASGTRDVDFFYKQRCVNPDGVNAIDLDGGCYLDTTGLIWSTRTAALIPWGAGVDDSEINGHAGVTDPDTSLNYCFDLSESGYNDWRMPTQSELTALSVVGGAQLTGVTAGAIWTSTMINATEARVMDTHSGTPYNRAIATSSFYVICVRDP